MVLAANLAFQDRRTILSFKNASAINSLSCHRILLCLAEFIPAALHYIANLDPRALPSLLFAVDARNTAGIHSRTIMLQCRIFEFKTNLSVPDAGVLAFIASIARTLNVSAVSTITQHYL